MTPLKGVNTKHANMRVVLCYRLIVANGHVSNNLQQHTHLVLDYDLTKLLGDRHDDIRSRQRNNEINMHPTLSK